jgi:hypothetical protein
MAARIVAAQQNHAWLMLARDGRRRLRLPTPPVLDLARATCIERTVEVAHAPAKVWAALSTAEGLAVWFGNEASIDLHPAQAGADQILPRPALTKYPCAVWDPSGRPGRILVGTIEALTAALRGKGIDRGRIGPAWAACHWRPR